MVQTGGLGEPGGRYTFKTGDKAVYGSTYVTKKPGADGDANE